MSGVRSGVHRRRWNVRIALSFAAPSGQHQDRLVRCGSGAPRCGGRVRVRHMEAGKNHHGEATDTAGGKSQGGDGQTPDDERDLFGAASYRLRFLRQALMQGARRGYCPGTRRDDGLHFQAPRADIWPERRDPLAFRKDPAYLPIAGDSRS